MSQVELLEKLNERFSQDPPTLTFYLDNKDIRFADPLSSRNRVFQIPLYIHIQEHSGRIIVQHRSPTWGVLFRKTCKSFDELCNNIREYANRRL